MDDDFKKYFEPTVDKWLEIGNDLSDKGQSEKAIKAYEEGLKIDSNYPPILFNLACIYENLGEYESALGLLNRFFTQYTDKFGLYKKSIILKRLNRDSEANSVFLQAENIDEGKDEIFCKDERKKVIELLKN